MEINNEDFESEELISKKVMNQSSKINKKEITLKNLNSSIDKIIYADEYLDIDECGANSSQ